MNVTETCSCGATFTAASATSPGEVRKALEQWRRDHKCSTNRTSEGSGSDGEGEVLRG